MMPLSSSLRDLFFNKVLIFILEDQLASYLKEQKEKYKNKSLNTKQKRNL